MNVRLTGQFDSSAQPRLRKAFEWITGPVTIDVSEATLSASALAELVCLAKRLGAHQVTLINPAPYLRRILSISQMDRFVSVSRAA